MSDDPLQLERRVEAGAGANAPFHGPVDARGQHELGWDLSHALRHPHLVAAHAHPLHPLRVDRVRQAILPLQLVDDPVAAPLLVAVADGAAVAVDPRRHDMHVVVGVGHDDVGRVPEAHALQIGARERAPLRVSQALLFVRVQGERAVVDRPRQVRVEPPEHAELVG